MFKFIVKGFNIREEVKKGLGIDSEGVFTVDFRKWFKPEPGLSGYVHELFDSIIEQTRCIPSDLVSAEFKITIANPSCGWKPEEEVLRLNLNRDEYSEREIDIYFNYCFYVIGPNSFSATTCTGQEVDDRSENNTIGVLLYTLFRHKLTDELSSRAPKGYKDDLEHRAFNASRIRISVSEHTSAQVFDKTNPNGEYYIISKEPNTKEDK